MHLPNKYVPYKKQLPTWEQYKKIQGSGTKEELDLRNRLIEFNLLLVLKMALRRKRKSLVPVDDLFQASIPGLIRAIEQFDLNTGTQFSTFAFYKIWSCMSRIDIVERRYRDRYGEEPFICDPRKKYGTSVFDSVANKNYRIEKELEEEERSSNIKLLLKKLSKREQLILKSYYFESMTLEEVGKLVGVTKERVRQIKERALLRLRNGNNRSTH